MKKTTSKLFAAMFCAAAVLALSASARAAVFQPDRIGFETGKINQNGAPDLVLFSVQPELVRGNVTAVVDINLIFDREFRLRDDGNDIVVLDSIALDRDNLKVRYGDLEGLTLGRGFIVDNYYSDIKNNVQSNEQKGIVFDTWSDRARITLFGTYSHLAGARAERSLGRVNVGATVVFDSDPDMEIYGLDAKLKIVPEKWSAYFEAADITHAGNGFAIGSAITPTPSLDLTVTGEYRKFDSDFAPGIVNAQYEAKPMLPGILSNPAGKIDGFYWGADFKTGEHTHLKAFYEDYEGARARTGLGASMKPSKRLAFDLFYAQENLVPSGNIRPEDSVALAKLNVGITKHIDLVFDYYHAFDDAGAPLKSFTTKLKFVRKR